MHSTYRTCAQVWSQNLAVAICPLLFPAARPSPPYVTYLVACAAGTSFFCNYTLKDTLAECCTFAEPNGDTADVDGLTVFLPDFSLRLSVSLRLSLLPCFFAGIETNSSPQFFSSHSCTRQARTQLELVIARFWSQEGHREGFWKLCVSFSHYLRSSRSASRLRSKLPSVIKQSISDRSSVGKDTLSPRPLLG